MRTLDGVLADARHRRPEALAVVGAGVALSYRAFEARVEALATRLEAEGVAPGMPVVVALERGVDAVVALAAVLEIGAVYVPLDPSYPAARRELVLVDVDARVVVTSTPGLAGARRAVDPASLAPDVRAWRTPRVRTRLPSDPATILYTSGSTGAPKGVVLTHGAWCTLLGAEDYVGVGPDDVVGHTAHVAFDAAFEATVRALAAGATLALVDADALLSPSALARWIEAQGVTIAFVATGLFNVLGRSAPSALRGPRVLYVGGDVMDPEAARAVLREPGARTVWNGYGPTEATAVTLAARFDDADAVPSPVPLGRPVAGATIAIVDDVGEPSDEGELVVGGPRVAPGYWRRPDDTSARFSRAGGGWRYHTGDRVRRTTDGAIHFVGRLDGQVKIRGFRAEPGELEHALRAHADVVEVAAVARADAQGEKALAAFVVARPGAFDAVTLRAHAAARLAPFLVPRWIIGVDALPRLPSGKVDRRALEAVPLEAEPGALHGAPTTEPAHETPTERAVSQLVARVLGVDEARADDDFFALGGFSLRVTQLLSRVDAELGVELASRAVFEGRTVRAIAAAVDAARAVAAHEGSAARAPTLTPLARAPGDGPRTHPVTYAQGRALFMEALEPGNVAYNSSAVIRLRGLLDVGALEAALSALVARHESLRTRFTSGPDGFVGVVEAPWVVTLAVSERPGLDDGERARAAAARARLDARRPFEVSRCPLVRWSLVRFADDDHALTHVEHHVIHDGWSFNVLLAEVFASYAARVEGRADPVVAPPVQLADVAAWQRALIASPVGRAQVERHRQRLLGAPNLEIPADHPRPPRQTFVGRAPRIHVPGDVVRALRAVAAAEGTTLFVVMYAALLVTLARRTGQLDLVVGTGLANRRARDVEGVLAMLVNNVVMRTSLDGDPTLREVLARARGVVVEAYDDQDAPFEQVVEALRLPRDPSRTPLMQAMFSFHDTPPPALDTAGLEVTLDLPIENGTSKLDLNVIGVPDAARRATGDGMQVVFEHNADLFEPATIARLADAYRGLLDVLPRALDRPLSALDVRTAGERAQLAAWGGLERELPTAYPRERSLAAQLAAFAARTPDAIALVAGDDVTRYDALVARAAAIAGHLRAHGVGRGDRVGLVAERTADGVAAMVAALALGAAYVPFDARYPAARLHHMLDVAAPRVVVVEGEAPSIAATCAARGLPMLALGALADAHAGALARAAIEAFGADVSGEDVAYVMFTSGSTGAPRGVEVPHRAVTRLVYGAEALALSADDVLLHLSPGSFDASTLELWGALLLGGRVVLHPSGTPSPASVAALVARHRVTTLWLTGSLFNAVVDDRPDALDGLRQVVTGGEALSVPHVARARARGVRVVNGYGPTEATTFTCLHVVDAPADSVATWGSVPIGRPLLGTHVHVVDASGAPAAIGAPGELWVGGDGVALGYRGRADATAERFVVRPAIAPGVLYRTGDRVRWRHDGALEFLGRADDQVKVRGHRVELGELDGVLTAIPGVRAAATVVHVDAQGEKHLVAYVVGEASEEAITRALRAALPEAVVPRVIVRVDGLPMTPVGKVDRAALAARPITLEIALEASSAAGADYAAIHDAPNDPSEAIMAELWGRLLGLEARGVRVGRHDNFFALGGHSLLAARLVDEM